MIFKNQMLIYHQSMATLDLNLFGKITHQLDKEVRKMLVRALLRLHGNVQQNYISQGK